LIPYDESAVGFAWIRTAGFCPPLIAHQSHAGQLRDLSAQAECPTRSLPARAVSRFDVDRQRQHWRIGGIRLAVDSAAPAGWPARKLDDALIADCTSFFGNVDIQAQIKL